MYDKVYVLVFSLVFVTEWIMCFKFKDNSRGYQSSFDDRTPYVDFEMLFDENNITQDFYIKKCPNQALGIKFHYMGYRNFTDIPMKRLAERGQFVPVKKTNATPALEWIDDYNMFYTVMMLDPDSPSVQNPVHRHWIHWLVVNIERITKKDGETLVEYIGPWPGEGTGRHRYVILVYEHRNKIDYSDFKKLEKDTFVARRNFDLKGFLQKYKLSDPVALNFFRSKYSCFIRDFYGKMIRNETGHEDYFEVSDWTGSEELEDFRSLADFNPK